MEEWISVAEAAEILGSKNEWIRRLCQRGTITCKKFGGSKSIWMVNRASVEAYAQSERKPGPKSPTYTQTPSPDLMLKENQADYTITIPITITPAQQIHLERQYNNVPDGIDTLINKDMETQ